MPEWSRRDRTFIFTYFACYWLLFTLSHPSSFIIRVCCVSIVPLRSWCVYNVINVLLQHCEHTHTNSKACNALHDNQLLQIFLILISDWYANCGSRSIFFSILVLSLYDQLNWSNPLLVYKLLGFDIFSFSFCVRSVWSFNSECSKNYADERDERMKKHTHTQNAYVHTIGIHKAP